MNPTTQEPESSLPPPPVPPSTTVAAMWALGVLAVIGVAGIIVVGVLLPGNTGLVLQVLTVILPVTGFLMTYLKSNQNAVSIQKVHVDLNSRLTAFMKVQAEAERAKGVLQGTEAAGGAQHAIIATATAEAARVARVAAETATAAAEQLTRAATEAAAALAASTPAHAQSVEPGADGTVVVTAPATIEVKAP